MEEFNCTHCGEYNPHGNTHCYACLTPRPVHCNTCGISNNPYDNTHCYNCGHALVYRTTHTHQTHYNHDTYVDLDGDGYTDVIIRNH